MRGPRSPASAGWLVLVLLARAPALADAPASESRWDAPIPGAFLGIHGSVFEGRFHVDGVSPGFAAAKAGIREDDVIVEIGGRSGFADTEAFLAWIRGLAPGQPVKVRLLRRQEALGLDLAPDHLGFRDLLQLLRVLEESAFIRDQEGFRDGMAAIVAEETEALRRAVTWNGAYEALNRAVGRFGLSHAAVIPPWTYRSFFLSRAVNEGVFQLGIIIEAPRQGPGPHFVLQVLNDSPAARAGLQVGDEILRVNGIEVASSPRLQLAGYESWLPYYVLAVEEGDRLRIERRRRADAEVEPVEAVIDRRSGEYRSTRSSLGTFEIEGRLIGYIHLWSFLPPGIDRLLAEALESGLGRGVEGWIFDIRGRGGRVDVLNRVLKLLEADPRPRVLLQDRNTRSAKEILAAKLRGKPQTRLVGERSAGSVLPANFLQLQDGAGLMLPSSPRTLGGLLPEPLEGVGVPPDVLVEVRLPYLDGADPILERGRQSLLDLLREVRRRRRF
jgi:C-terminal processing protease CtpA/Prc